MPKFFRRGHSLLITSLMACVSSVCVFVFLLAQNSTSYAKALSVEYNADQVIIKVNERRQASKLPALKKESLLTRAAENKTQDMIENSYFSHVSPVDGRKWSDFIHEVDYDYVEAGENLANGYASVDDMVQAWMDSPTHRANIMADGYIETGVSIDTGELNGHQTIFVTQVFGRR